MKEILGDEVYHVTQEGGTESPFTGKYYKNKEVGTYHCIVCGAELFDSNTKFDSYSGWPSFYDVKNNYSIDLFPDKSGGMNRTEVKCKKCNAHLGHLFNDAVETPTGQRYCINSVSLNFKNKDGEDS